MALYGPAIKKLIKPGPHDPRIDPSLVILHIAVSEAESLFGYFNGPSGGVESHFYVRKNGVVEQYRDTAFEADANTDANPYAISIETEGLEHGTWTKAQLESIKAIIVWARDTHGIPLTVPQKWNGSGVGFHVQFPGRWDRRGATCPGPARQRQYWEVLVPWMGTLSGGGAQSVEFEVPKPKEKESRFWEPTGDYSVRKIQGIVDVAQDGLYGPATKAAVAEYQRELGVMADGYFGPVTEAAHEKALKRKPLVKAKAKTKFPPFPLKEGWYFGPRSGPRYSVSGYYSHRKDLKRVQRRLKRRGWSIKVDGFYGPQTARVVRAFQEEKGLVVDGLIGKVTWTKAWTAEVTP